MSSKLKIYLGVGISFVALAVLAFLVNHVYTYGYKEGYSASETYYLSQLEKIKQSQKAEQERISELELELFNASKKYEDLNLSFAKVQKENEKWKSQTEDAKKEALLPSTVNRINQILDSYSSQ